jgi:hypothetical protein
LRPTVALSAAPIAWSVEATAGSKLYAVASGIGNTVRNP